jgi:hypothetical protein
MATEIALHDGLGRRIPLLQGAHIQNWEKLAREADQDFVRFWEARANSPGGQARRARRRVSSTRGREAGGRD